MLDLGTGFEGTPLENRRDGYPAGGVPYMNQYRIARITDAFGQEVKVSDESPTCSLSNPNWSTNTTNCFPMYRKARGSNAS